MKLLLDTQAFLWFALDAPNLSATARAHIVDPAHDKYVSPATFWEVAIKIRTGKYTLAQPYADFFRQGIYANGFSILPIEIAHTERVATLPLHHRDPFDRLIVAQAMAEGMTIISSDAQLDAYGVPRIW